MHFPKTLSSLAGALLVLGALFGGAAQAVSQTTPIFVELNSPAPTVVARYQANQAGEVFDEALHRATVQLAQDEFLLLLGSLGVDYEVTTSTLNTATGALSVPDRYSELINAVRLEVPSWDVGTIRRQSEVKHITVDELQYLHLNNSVRYIRANGPNSARSMGVRGTGEVNADGSASGQVIAVLDTGIDHTNPMWDSRFSDADFEMRSGDVRPVRLSGAPYMDGTNHPKVAYRYLIGTAPVEGDDTGHGTNSSSTAGGLKARADSILNNGEIVEGVAPGAVMMDYKVCPSLSCVNQSTLLALEDTVMTTDLAGNPKPVATVINMSFGSDAGDPNSATGVAAGNLQYAGVVPVASAGNSGPQENIVGSPSSHRRVISVAATLDPGLAPNSVDVLLDGVCCAAPGAVPDPPQALPVDFGGLLSFFSPESNAAQGFDSAIAQHYVDVGFADTPDDIPLAANGRICLAERGGDVNTDQGGSGLFANKAAQCAASGGIAVVVYNNVPGAIGVVLGPAAIPMFTMSREDGLLLRDTVGFDGGGISNQPIRLNTSDGNLFQPDTTGFSSRGPNNDYAVVKPDITAPGAEILMGASKIGALGSPTNFIAASGTSFSGPHIAGVAALMRDAIARPDMTPSQVRLAMMNTATNLREGDGTPIDDSDDRNFIHETGAGLVEVVEMIGVKAVMGSNNLNGAGGPDDPTDPDFLPSHSFGERNWIGTGVADSDPSQRATITVTVADVGGGAGSYNLQLVDAGHGDITRPLTESGFSLSLSSATVAVPSGGRGTFQVEVAVDGTAGGLQIAGNDVNGAPGTEFLWYVVASNANESIRMPMYLRVTDGSAPVLMAADDLANTPVDTPVVIDVLANDSGAGLSVTGVTTPANGSAVVNGDNTVTYTPSAGFQGSDTFDYTVTDGTSTDSATVTVLVGSSCQSTGSFFDDFESGAAGWSVDTATNEDVLGNPNLASPTWQVALDALAQSTTQAFTSDSAAGLLKDDRLVSPSIVVSTNSQLVFWHYYDFDVGSGGPIDGGVLEVSVDGGAWQDIVDAGGAFTAGGYNGTMRAIGNPGVIPGRNAWTGASQWIDAMVQATVDLNAFATKEVRFRWRLTTDGTVVIGDPPEHPGWGIDNVQVTRTGCADVNNAPIANPDTAETDVNMAVTIPVLANDSDPDGDPLTVTDVTDPPHGTATINPDGSVTYTPDLDFEGEDSFVYAIEDGRGGSATASVTVTVNGDGGTTGEGDKVTGGGWIPDGGDKSNFGFNAKQTTPAAKGHLNYQAKSSALHVQGDVDQVDVNEFDATFSGHCSDGSCDFTVYVEDNAEPGSGADRFSIEVFAPGGSVPIHQADELLGGGNIQIHRKSD